MPHSTRYRTANEHLIFVKNVPGYIAEDTISQLFSKYNPQEINNLYPHSSMTTIVISFRTKLDAARAQKDTDQLRSNNVILQVETYNRQQSTRRFRDKGPKTEPQGAFDDGGECDTVGEARTELGLREETHTENSESSGAEMHETPAGATWANVVAHIQDQSVKNAREIGILSSPQATRLLTGTARRKSEPLLNSRPSSEIGSESLLHSRLSILESDTTAVLAQAESGEESRYSVDTMEKDEQPDVLTTEPDQHAASEERGWEPTDTTDRLRQRHHRGCVFCWRRTRNQMA